jgi:MFS family permease
MTVQGVGDALSPALGGAIAQAVGYRITFLIQGAFALGSSLRQRRRRGRRGRSLFTDMNDAV